MQEMQSGRFIAACGRHVTDFLQMDEMRMMCMDKVWEDDGVEPEKKSNMLRRMSWTVPAVEGEFWKGDKEESEGEVKDQVLELRPTRLKNSFRVLDLRSKQPRTQLVIVELEVCWTPRMTMQR